MKSQIFLLFLGASFYCEFYVIRLISYYFCFFTASSLESHFFDSKYFCFLLYIWIDLSNWLCMKCNASTFLCPTIFYYLQGPAGLVEFKVGLKVADNAQTKFLKLKKEFATYLKLVLTLSYFLLHLFCYFFFLYEFSSISVA